MKKDTVVTILTALKTNTPCGASPIVPVTQKGYVVAVLRVVSEASLNDTSEVKRLALWRKKNNKFFPKQFRVTIAGTKKWSREQLLNREDRILFMIEDLSGKPVGHVGLNRFDYTKKSCEIDNIIRGVAGNAGLMTASVESLCRWGKEILGVKYYTLQVAPANRKAIALYRRCGFVETKCDEMNMYMKKL